MRTKCDLKRGGIEDEFIQLLSPSPPSEPANARLLSFAKIGKEVNVE